MKNLFIFCSLILTAPAFAQISDGVFTSDQFQESDLELVTRDLTAAFSHTTNSGASNLGSIFGFEVGLVGGIVDASNLQGVAERLSGEKQDDLEYLPTGGLVAGVALPMGFGAELSMIPKIEVQDVAISNVSVAARWSITDMFPLVGTFSPLKLTARGSYGTAKFDYKFNFNSGADETVDIDVNTLELGVVAGVNLIFFEPYIGLGFVDSRSDLVATADETIGAIVVQETEKESVDISGTKTTAGFLFKLPLLRIGVEYANLKGVDRYTLKLALKI